MSILPFRFNTHEENDWLERNRYLDFKPTEIEIDNERIVKLQEISQAYLNKLKQFKYNIEFLPKGLCDKSKEISLRSLVDINPSNRIELLNQHHDFVFPVGTIDLYAGELEYSYKYTPNTPCVITAQVYMAYSEKQDTKLVIVIDDKIIGYYHYDFKSYITSATQEENKYTLSIGSVMLGYDDTPQTDCICYMTIVNDQHNHFHLNLIATSTGYWFESKFNPNMLSCIAPGQKLSTISLGLKKNYQIYKYLFGSRGISNRIMSMGYNRNGVNHPLFEISNRLTLLDENSEAFDVEYYLDVHLDSGKVKRYLLEVGAHSYVEEDNFDIINVSSDKVEFIIPIDKHIPAPDLTDKSGRSLKRIKYALHLVTPDGESMPTEFTDKLIEKGHINVLRIAPIGDAIHGNPDDYIMIRPNHNKEDKTDELYYKCEYIPKLPCHQC